MFELILECGLSSIVLTDLMLSLVTVPDEDADAAATDSKVASDRRTVAFSSTNFFDITPLSQRIKSNLKPSSREGSHELEAFDELDEENDGEEAAEDSTVVPMDEAADERWQ